MRDKLRALQTGKNSQLGIVIAPKLERMPIPMQKYDEPLLPFGKGIIQATRDLVCAYLFDFPSYLKFGAAGAIALERTIDYVGEDAVTILHGHFADRRYQVLTDPIGFGADAITVIEGYGQNERTIVMTFENDTIDLDGQMLMIGEQVIRLVGDAKLHSGLGENFGPELRKWIEALK
ncbi:MAG: hypothetical protein MUF87_06390 [Anaerolineae bacterium]|nr:hypothetical protein [Anaerolineae bacterium]